MPVWMLVYVLFTISFENPTFAQTSAFEMGLQQIESARRDRTIESYQAAEETFTTVLDENPHHAKALVHRGEAKIGRGVLVLGTALNTAIELFRSGIADMDRAAALAPDDLRVRLTRGLTYIEFPSYYDKRDVARGDLEFSVGHPTFSTLPMSVRERALRSLERAKKVGVAGQ